MPNRQFDREQEILEFWGKRRIFEQTLERDAPHGEFVFFEGPPTANAPPGIHHAESRTYKDVIPRYKAMRGYRVHRKAGWDTHGLPVELQIEKKLGLKTKRDIEQYGVAAFNAACRDSVWEFKEKWEDLTRKVGYWVDLDDPYITYAMPYVESIWWFLEQAWNKQLLVRDYKIVPWCPRCETPLSSHEVAQGYEDDVEDPSVFVRFVLTPESIAKLGVPERTAMLVWTTTPWTLPANLALAVHPEVEYVVVQHQDAHYVLARTLVERVWGNDAQVVMTIRGADLVMATYQPLYTDRTDATGAYTVRAADFVSLNDGTGIVHIAPAYGEDDFRLGKEWGLPVVFSVDEKGIMAEGLPGAGRFAKQADVDIRADLTARGLLFRDTTIRHTYPFCWRCKTPLLYFARASWYIQMAKLREEIQKKNQTIQWHPEHLRDGRFGEWLRELKDWAITRERYWGTPLPLWRCDGCGHDELVGSFARLLTKAKKRNRFLLMRHGESESNARGVISTRLTTSDRYPLTAQGVERVHHAAQQLAKECITKIFASPYARMRETAEHVGKMIGVSVQYDDRLREIDLPDWDGKTVAEFEQQFASTAEMYAEMFTRKVGTNETWDELARRMMLALRDIDAQCAGETILICTHGDPLFLLQWACSGRTRAGIVEMPYPAFDDPHELPFIGALVNDRGELDVHRPYIDGVTWSCTQEGCAGTMRRYPEVVDVWLDSGCMPFAQSHFPFEGQAESVVPELYPADYIAEAIDQTRGWFYTLLAVATVLGWEAPYRHVISLGHLLDQQGQKMSKSKGNIVNPWDMIERYGADVVRWYMLAVNQPWDPKLFDEEDLKRMSRKPFGTLGNVIEFWKLHGGNAAPAWSSLMVVDDAGVLLDHWLRARTRQAYDFATQHLDAYAVTEAARVVGDLVDDVSTWWLRRSRERLKEGDPGARASFTAALRSIAILLAPFAPFTAEHLWQTLRDAGVHAADVPESVHLASWEHAWPNAEASDERVLPQMDMVRHYCSLGLEARTASGMPVRQALAALTIRRAPGTFSPALLAIIAAELNVKEVREDMAIPTEVDLETTLTPALLREGMLRDLIRQVNTIRKQMGLAPTDRIRVRYHTDHPELAHAIATHLDLLLRSTVAEAWDLGTPSAPTELVIGDAQIHVEVARAG
ncbi:class I tRNA ligase family protein [Candidatus Uhrbacteria bacterium]|nr:class I tRNA ligase family protein [Candidatus Uhrbacteria bacterium]